ncbi:MAG: translation initiation factor IF-2 subunit alpha [Candidatus Thermoplasmatota archaeon]|nr:translation initiation factor IF-2 subunit alpha [Candidatus Thermoplasmatota archaeon]
MPAKDLPERGELVVCTVEKAKGFGAFVRLEEYPDTEGFIHIKEVAPGWIKNIRNHVKEGQRIVCKVMDVDPSKGYIDLSLKRVNDHQRRETIQQWKNESKAHKLLQIVAERLGKSVDECYQEFGNDLIGHYESLYAAFEEAAYDESTLAEDGFSGSWMDAFVEVARENIIIPFVTITGYVEIFSPEREGIENVRQALQQIEGKTEDVTVSVKYVSAPIYRIDVTAPDYKLAEKELRERAERGVAYIREHDGVGSFKRTIK